MGLVFQNDLQMCNPEIQGPPLVNWSTSCDTCYRELSLQTHQCLKYYKRFFKSIFSDQNS